MTLLAVAGAFLGTCLFLYAVKATQTVMVTMTHGISAVAC
jgi:hypothetical protein